MTPKIRIQLLAFLTAALGGESASAQRPPTDMELGASYCIPIVQGAIEAGRELVQRDSAPIFEQGLREREAALNRLQGYVLPRLRYLDLDAVTLALARGRTDVAERKRLLNACYIKCEGKADFLGCMTDCPMPHGLVERIDLCLKPDWLPF